MAAKRVGAADPGGSAECVARHLLHSPDPRMLLQLLVVAAVAVGVAMVFMQICSAPQNPHNVSVLFISLLAGAPIHRFLALFLNA